MAKLYTCPVCEHENEYDSEGGHDVFFECEDCGTELEIINTGKSVRIVDDEVVGN